MTFPGRGHMLRPTDQPSDPPALPQLWLGAIIIIWAAAAVPIGALAWVGAPLLADQLPGQAASVAP
jgi:uncharacterized protein